MTVSSVNTALRWRPRHSMPNVVLSVALQENVNQVLREILPSEARLIISLDCKEAERMLATLPDACMAFAVPSTADLSFINGFGRLRKLFPHVETLLIFDQQTSDPGAVLELGVFGASDLVSIGARVDGEVLRRGLSECHSETIAKRLWTTANLRVPESLVPVLKAALRNAHGPITGARLAEVAGMHERTLRKYCTQRHLPSPQWIIGWARLLIAAHYLDEPGRSVERIAELLGYPSPTALRNQLRRYTELTATELRKLGAVTQVGRSIERAVREAGAPQNDPPADRPPLSLVV